MTRLTQIENGLGEEVILKGAAEIWTKELRSNF